MYKSNLSFWSVDAFLYMAMDRCQESVWSSELASRVASFVDAYVLFDKVVLLERYRDKAVIRELDPVGEIFEFVASAQLQHSDDLTNGITLDLSATTVLSSLRAENQKWFSQHCGYASENDCQEFSDDSGVTMAEIRLWQHCLVNEVADLTGSVSLLPPSLQGIAHRMSPSQGKSFNPFQSDKYAELHELYQGKLKLINEVIGAQESSYLTGIPPFLTLMIDQALSPPHLVEVLVQMRRDYVGLRRIGSMYLAEVDGAKTVRDKIEVVEEWGRSWSRLVKGDFREPQLLSKRVSSSDVSKSVWSPISIASIATRKFLDHIEERSEYQRLEVFSELFSELDSIADLRRSLKKKFFLDLSNSL
jgi:hypothetical protein